MHPCMHRGHHTSHLPTGVQGAQRLLGMLFRSPGPVGAAESRHPCSLSCCILWIVMQGEVQAGKTPVSLRVPSGCMLCLTSCTVACQMKLHTRGISSLLAVGEIGLTTIFPTAALQGNAILKHGILPCKALLACIYGVNASRQPPVWE